MNTPRLVVAGHLSPGCHVLDIAPDFGTQDEWTRVMQDAVDATPEQQDICTWYDMGRMDGLDNKYAPPSWRNAQNFDDYIRGINDAQAERDGRTLWR